jgi:tetratricopeptide (TPR) repeat protein
MLETIRGLLRAKKPHPALAESRINEVLNADKGNAEAWLLKAELLSRTSKGVAALNTVFENAIQAAPTPELFHQRANLVRGSRGGGRLDSAAEVIRSACALFPSDGRLKRRFAGILIGQGAYTEAHDVLRRALDLEPTMSDTYGMLGDVLTAQGAAKWPEAAQYIDEALRLAPQAPAHWVRQARLERLQGAVDPDSRDARWDKAQALLDDALKREARNIPGLLEMAILLLDRQDDEDLGRVGFLLEQIGDRAGGARRQIQQARFHARKGEAGPAQTILNRLLERDPTNFGARAALGELYLHQGRVFEALSATIEAQGAAPPHAPERVVYEQVIARLRHLIDSGQALELAKAAEVAQGAEAPVETGPVTSEMPQSGPVRGDAVGVRLAGRTTRRRKRKKDEIEGAED